MNKIGIHIDHWLWQNSKILAIKKGDTILDTVNLKKNYKMLWIYDYK